MTGVSLFMVSIMVPDMDDAIEHYTHDWGFTLVSDSRHLSGHRWVEVAPDGGAKLRLVEASNEEQREVIGRQVANRVAFFLNLVEFEATVARWANNGIQIAEPSRQESFGKVTVLKDKYGNRWDALDAETGFGS